MKRHLGSIIVVIAGFFALRVYLIRELLTLELIFTLGFVALGVLVALAYLVGLVTQYSLHVAQMTLRWIGEWAQTSFQRGFGREAAKPLKPGADLSVS